MLLWHKLLFNMSNNYNNVIDLIHSYDAYQISKTCNGIWLKKIHVVKNIWCWRVLFSNDTTMAVVHIHVRENRRDNTETQSILHTRIYSRSYMIKHLALKVVRNTVLLQYDAFIVAFEITNRTLLTSKCRSNVENTHHVYIEVPCTRYVTRALLLS